MNPDILNHITRAAEMLRNDGTTHRVRIAADLLNRIATALEFGSPYPTHEFAREFDAYNELPPSCLGGHASVDGNRGQDHGEQAVPVGYYWIKTSVGKWEVALCCPGGWGFIGDDCMMCHEDAMRLVIAEIGPYLGTSPSP